MRRKTAPPRRSNGFRAGNTGGVGGTYEDTNMYLMIFLYFIPGEPVPLLESAWYTERAQCEAAVASMSESAMASDVIVLHADCVDGLP